MGSTLNCCNAEKKDVSANEELNLENTKNNFNYKPERVEKPERVITLATQEKLIESFDSPKVSNTNRDMLVQHLKKASYGKLEEIKDEGHFENLEKFDPVLCPIFSVYMTNIYDLNSQPRILQINHLGLEGSLRGANDGVVYFGSLDETFDSSLDVILNFTQLMDERA